MPQQQQPNKKRLVRFNPLVEIYHVPGILALVAGGAHTHAPSVLESLWFKDEEFAKSQREVKRTIRAMRREQISQSQSTSSSSSSAVPSLDHHRNEDANAKRKHKQYCYRGLEHLRSDAHLEQRRINKDCLVQAVFAEQQRQQWDQQQRQGGLVLHDDERIAEASRRHSAWAKKHAREMGESDARAACACVRRVNNNNNTIGGGGGGGVGGGRTPPLRASDLLSAALSAAAAATSRGGDVVEGELHDEDKTASTTEAPGTKEMLVAPKLILPRKRPEASPTSLQGSLRRGREAL